jgi:hypothetical protein
VLASTFIAIGILNVLIMLCGVPFLAGAIFFSFVPAGRAELAGSKSGADILLPLMCFALAGMLFVFVPHSRTDNHIHGHQAHADLTREYGQVEEISLYDHWAIVRIPGCTPLIKHEMRRVDGHYWLAYGVEAKDKYGDLYTARYQPVPRSQLITLCEARGDSSRDHVIALG